MSCIKNCECKDCEMLVTDWSMVLIKGDGFDETRQIVPCVKCGYDIRFALSVDDLKTSKLHDDFIYMD